MEEILGYIRSERANGHSDDAIRASLKSAGWEEVKIDQAFAMVNSAPVEHSQATPAQPKGMVFLRKYRLPIFSALILVILGLGGYKAYSYFYVNGPEKIWADTSKKMLDIDSAKFNFEVSYSENVPKDFDAQDLFGLVAPGGEISFGVVGKGGMTVKNKDADYDMTSTLNYKLGNLKVSFDFESKKVGNYLYYKVEGNPFAGLLAGGSQSDTKSSWLKIDLGDKDSEFALLDNQKNQILEAYKKAKLMKPSKLLGDENIDGTATWHYQASLDKQELKNYFDQLTRILGEGEDELSADDKKVLNSLIDRIEFKKLELWIGKSDHLVHQALIETNAPSIIHVFSDTGSASSKSRDARRISDMRQVTTALELYYNDNGRYPAAKNSKPVFTDGPKNKTLSEYLNAYPTAPSPADGKCSEEDNKYKYQQLEGGKAYKINFCIGSDSGGYKPGIMEANMSGLKNVRVYEAVAEDPLAGNPFTGKITVKLNLNNFNTNIKIDEPLDAKEIDVKNPRAQSRDARRLADMRQMMTGLELFYNDNGRYPTATNGEPTPADGVKDAQFRTYIAETPRAPTPADGSCTEAQNKYTYSQLQNGASYKLNFCIGESAGGYSAGTHTASPSGLQ
ncbi:MAG: type II secretion system protein GspG [Candidatus Doudnabacteria bacterium]|nr:type II secretion system protein GspG [Candidatus Doudnabacteria bacterium]